MIEKYVFNNIFNVNTIADGFLMFHKLLIADKLTFI